MPTALSVFGVQPKRIGSNEAFARELSRQLGEAGWTSVLCFVSEPPPRVREFLALPNVVFEVVPEVWRNDWAPLAGLARVVRRHRPDVLHLHYVGFLSAYPWMARLLGVKRIFFTDHTSRPEGHVIRLAPVWKRALTRLVTIPLDRVVSVSRFGQRCLVEAGLVPADRSVLIYNAVDVDRIVAMPDNSAAFRRRFGIPDDRAIVLQVSWLIPEKGVQDLLRSAPAVLAAHPGVQFVIVGEGREEAALRQLAADLGVAGHVTWTGLLEDPVAEGAFHAADVVCQVSRWEELFGWTITEAMAVGRPVVGTRVGGIPEILTDGDTGYLVPRADPHALAACLNGLLGDAPRRAIVGAAARLEAGRRFQLASNVAGLANLYRRVGATARDRRAA